MQTAGIIVIGNEILSGKTEETNARFLIAELRSLGVSLRRITVIADDVEEIAMTIRDFSQRLDIVFTSGGVGPTHDDVTLEGIARGFERNLTRDSELESLLRAHYGPRLHERTLRMADLPQGATLLRTSSEPWPAILIENVYVLPGVPEIFRRKFFALRDRFRAEPFIVKNLYLRSDEDAVAHLLERAQVDFPMVEIGSYPRPSSEENRVRVTLESKDADAVARATRALLELLPKEFVLRIEPSEG